MASKVPAPTKFAAPSAVERGCRVVDVEGRSVIQHVLAVDTHKRQVVVARQPYTLDGKGGVQKYALKFESIQPIYGGFSRPCMFHCYGPLQ